MKNSLSIMKYIFCIIGLIILLQTFYIYQEKKTFLEKANIASGIVVDNSTSETPLVSFKIKDGGQKVIFYGSNNVISYKDNESVEVLYNPDNPNEAEINEFSSLYLAILVLGGIGAIFFLTGFSFFLFDYFKQKKINFLKQSGRSIVTKFIDVQLNLNVSVNGSHPYFICSQWLDSKSNKVYNFESDDIWFNPEDFIKNEEIKVIIDPQAPTRYFMDISFLPKKKNWLEKLIE
jgi:hypothetical protein